MTHGCARRSWSVGCAVPFLAALLQILFTHSAEAQTSQNLPPDARARGMGEAYTAIAEGAAATWWNPGALGLLDRISLTFISPMDYGPRQDGGNIIHRSFGISGRQRALGYGVHLNHMQWGQSDLTNEQGMPIGSYKPFDYTLLMGVGTDLLPAFRLRSKYIKLGVGSNLRVVHHNAPPARFALDHRSDSATGWDFDVGMLTTVQMPFDLDPTDHHLGASFAAVHLGAVRTAVFERKIGTGGGHSDDLERLSRVGGAVELGLADVRPIGHLVRAIYAVERHEEPNWSRLYDVWGLEVTLLNFLSIRTGHIDDPDHAYVVDTHGVGAGFYWKGLFGGRLDYANHRRGAFNGELEMYTFTVSLDPHLFTARQH
jgi:hypothetical protein